MNETSKSYSVHLTYLPYESGIPNFDIFRKCREPTDQKPEGTVFGFSLPIESDTESRRAYWVAFEGLGGYHRYNFKPQDNRFLTLRAMAHGLVKRAQSILAPDEIEEGTSFYRDVRFNFNRHKEGVEQLVAEPYYLREHNCYGWLLDYHFSLADGVQYSRKVQQLCLSLDKSFRRNLNASIDRKSKILEFLEARREVFDAIKFENESFRPRLSTKFSRLEADFLKPKVYYFSNNKTSRAQYAGLRDYGPLEELKSIPQFIFIFEERFRHSARKLAAALRGSREYSSASFPGFERLFRASPLIDSNPVVIPDSSIESCKSALGGVRSRIKPGYTAIPILVLPDGSENGYMEHKAVFVNAGLPTQVCTLRVIEDRVALKWSIANIALQVFCKCGGRPWKVRPTSKNALIIGISQSHKRVDGGDAESIEKYFAFSVMTDNSGLFQEISVLSEEATLEAYIDRLKRSLDRMLTEQTGKYDRVVLHTSFRLKNAEIQAIRDVVVEVQESCDHECEFAVVKVNQKNRFFGFNESTNNLVPFEGSFVKLGRGEYLVWFEGIYRDQQTANKAFPGPTHVSIMDIKEHGQVPDSTILQDLLNLSGANWRGFNAKSAPVSIFYCHLIAELVGEFQMRGLPLPAVSDLHPWFL